MEHVFTGIRVETTGHQDNWIVARRPLVLQLQKTKGRQKEYAEFGHMPHVSHFLSKSPHRSMRIEAYMCHCSGIGLPIGKHIVPNTPVSCNFFFL
ncbi:hypothetical protein HanIR_Chr05g0255361 [Helianthus annuus]|nr:hypothetical protein HanIR_Chr05g0255361 [Helianthus annuus]